MPYIGTAPASELKILDINGEKFILDADADTHITADTDDQIDIAIAGADDFQFTANKFLVQSGSSIDINGTELIIDADADTSLTADTDDQIDIKVGGTDYFKFTTTQFGGVQGSASVPAFAWATDPNTGIFFGTNGNGQISFTGEGIERMRIMSISSGAQVMIGDTASSNTDCGLTINQIAYDDHILTFKSSDVSVSAAQFSVEADTFGQFMKHSSASGGMRVSGYSEGSIGVATYSWTNTQPGTSPPTTMTDVPFYNVALIYESSDYAFSGNAVLWGLRKTTAGGSGRSIAFFDEDGDLLLDGSSSNTAFDEEDDALLCRSFDLLRNPKQVIRSEFDKWTGDYKTSLEDAGILTKIDPDNPQHRNDDGTLGDPMVNVTQLQRLHNGAIWQQRAMFETMKQVADEMIPGFGTKLNERLAEQKLPALPVPA